jgi:amino acid transporter
MRPVDNLFHYRDYIGIPIFFLCYFGHKFTAGKKDPWIIPSKKVDLHTGLEEILASETPRPPPEKWYMKWKAVYQ